MSSTQVRPRRTSDLPACLEILTAVYEKDAYPVQGPSTSFLLSPNTLEAWVATSPSASGSRETTLGHVALSSPSDSDVAVKLWRSQQRGENIAVLERLFVAPNARRVGVAEALIRRAVDEGRERGVRVVLFALIKDQGAMRLYERVGWAEFGRVGYEFDGKEGKDLMEAVCYVSPA